MRKRRSKTAYKTTSATSYRVNREIRVREVRLIDHNGENHGIVPIAKARQLAEDAELDLVEVAPNADPPVCRIMDFGKFAYEKTKKERDAHKHQKQIEIKTIRLTPRTSGFHKEVHVQRAKQWLGEGKKVKFQVRFKGREITHPELGKQALEEIAGDLSELATIEQEPKLEGWSMTLLMTPTNL